MASPADRTNFRRLAGADFDPCVAQEFLARIGIEPYVDVDLPSCRRRGPVKQRRSSAHGQNGFRIAAAAPELQQELVKPGVRDEMVVVEEDHVSASRKG